MNRVYSKCLSFFFTRFDGLKLFTHQSDLQFLWNAFLALFRFTAVFLVITSILMLKRIFNPCHFAAPQLHDPSKRGVPFLAELSWSWCTRLGSCQKLTSQCRPAPVRLLRSFHPASHVRRPSGLHRLATGTKRLPRLTP